MKINEFKESDEFQKKEMDEKLSGVELEKIISLSYFVINAHKAKAIIANYAQTECQFRYCGTAIPFLTVRSTAR